MAFLELRRTRSSLGCTMQRRQSFEKSRLPAIKQEWLSPEQEAFLNKNKRRGSGY